MEHCHTTDAIAMYLYSRRHDHLLSPSEYAHFAIKKLQKTSYMDEAIRTGLMIVYKTCPDDFFAYASVLGPELVQYVGY